MHEQANAEKAGGGETASLAVSEDFNPFELRSLTHPTTDIETLIHLLKGCLGSGILAMPYAFSHIGLAAGMVATILTGYICAYCIHLLVQSAHILYRRLKVPYLSYAGVAEAAFKNGPPFFHRFARVSKFVINLFLVVDLLGCCCIYVVFVSRNLKEVIDHTMELKVDVRLYMLALLPLLLAMNLVRRLKYLVPFSMISNVLVAVALIITAYYVFQDLPPLSSRPQIISITQFPIFFATAVFAIEGIGVVMPLENHMKTPQHLIGCPSVLCVSMTCVVMLYFLVGFFGYLKYGDHTKGSITLNLPNLPLAQSVKVIIAVAVLLTYALQFYVPMNIIWKGIKHRFTDHPYLAEYALRIILVVSTVAAAIALPDLGPFISLVGAVCLSSLGLMFPALINLIVIWESPGPGKWYRNFWRNVLVLLFGAISFITGTYCSILEIIEFYQENKNDI